MGKFSSRSWRTRCRIDKWEVETFAEAISAGKGSQGATRLPLFSKHQLQEFQNARLLRLLLGCTLTHYLISASWRSSELLHFAPL